MSPELTGDPVGRERLRREARAAAALTHPGICTVYALEEFDGELFIATEFWTATRSAKRSRAAGRCPPRSDADRARDRGGSRECARPGLTHRDLKPENVMRARDGRLKILDFGLARSDGPSSDPLAARITQPATVIGTPAYMAPEQLNGDPVDARADVFAFGVLVYRARDGCASLRGGHADRDHRARARKRSSSPGTPRSHGAAVSRRRGGSLPAKSTIGTVCVGLGDRGCARSQLRERARGICRGLVAGTSPGNHGAVRIAAVLAWQAMEWQQGATAAVFIAIGVAATVGGVLRGHLLFTAAINRAGLDAERRRAGPVTLAVDLAVAAGLAVDGLMLGVRAPGCRRSDARAGCWHRAREGGAGIVDDRCRVPSGVLGWLTLPCGPLVRRTRSAP